MKKNTMMRLASVLLVLCLLTTSVISGTFAKYTSTAEASDTARVANWEIIYTGGSNAGVDITGTSSTIVFDLFNTVNEADTTSAEEHVKKDATTAIIAPGTGGSFSMKIENKSEVTATYAIDYTVEYNGVPLEFSVGNTTSWASDLADVSATTIDMENGSATITVYWRWAFERGNTDDEKATNNGADTSLGTAASLAQPRVTAKITATQVD